jgi:hypothetical protein
MRKLGWWVGWLVMSLVACGGVALDEQAEDGNDAGRGNDAGESGVTSGEGGVDGVTAGKGGTAGDTGGTGGTGADAGSTGGDAGSTGGDAGSTGGDAPKELARCDAVGLEFLCSEPDSCFGNPSAISQLCSAGAKVERASSSCGGAV